MLLHVLLRELDSDREYTNCKDDTGELERDGVYDFVIAVAPAAGIEYVGAVGT